jgi:hypothetical protein
MCLLTKNLSQKYGKMYTCLLYFNRLTVMTILSYLMQIFTDNVYVI